MLRYIDSIEDDGKLEVCHKLTSALSAIMECVTDAVLQTRISDVAFAFAADRCNSSLLELIADLNGYAVTFENVEKLVDVMKAHKDPQESWTDAIKTGLQALFVPIGKFAIKDDQIFRVTDLSRRFLPKVAEFLTRVSKGPDQGAWTRMFVAFVQVAALVADLPEQGPTDTLPDVVDSSLLKKIVDKIMQCNKLVDEFAKECQEPGLVSIGEHFTGKLWPRAQDIVKSVMHRPVRSLLQVHIDECVKSGHQLHQVCRGRSDGESWTKDATAADFENHMKKPS